MYKQNSKAKQMGCQNLVLAVFELVYVGVTTFSEINTMTNFPASFTKALIVSIFSYIRTDG